MTETKEIRYIYIDIPYIIKIIRKDTDGDMLSDGEELVAQYKGDGTISHYKMRSHPLIADSDGDGIRDLMDKNPLSFDITDKIQSYVAGLAYTNLESSVGKTIGELMDTGMEFKSLDKEFANILRNFEVIYGDDSSPTGDFVGLGYGAIALRMDNISGKDEIIIGYRGTESFANWDGLTDLMAGLMLDHVQGVNAYATYNIIANNYSKNDIYLTGHSLGGRLVQDALRYIYKFNNKKEPVKATTFNALGFNNVDAI